MPDTSGPFSRRRRRRGRISHRRRSSPKPTSAIDSALSSQNTAWQIGSAAKIGRRLIYGGHIISLARALSFNGLANGQLIAAINAGAHANPTFAGDTIYAWSEVLERIELPGRTELLVVVLGGVFVMETLSVMIQVASFKLTGRRVFRMAPIHHHFEQKGWKEPQVVIRFWIIAVILALIGLSTLKLR